MYSPSTATRTCPIGSSYPRSKEEIDVEGLDIEEDRLWIVGSHTSTRKGIKPDKDPEENLRRLAQVEARPNRCLIACATTDRS